MSLKKLFFQMSFFSLILIGPISAQDNQTYELDKSIQVFDRSSGKTTTLRPNEGLTFQITGSSGGAYKLRITDSQGNVRAGDFVSAKSNIDNGFVIAGVVSQFDDVVEALKDFDRCDKCDQMRESGIIEKDEEVVTGSCDIPGTDTDWKRKCNQLYSKGIPKEALDYALKAMKLNATSFRTNKCFDRKGLMGSGHYSMMGMTGDKLENDLLANGLPNKCQMIINDTDDRSPSSGGDNCRGRMYYIDLCKGNEAVVKKDYFNLGTGTCRGGKNGFRNGSGLNTTIKGVFFTHTKTFNFAKNNKAYRDARKRVQRAGGPNQATALQLFGLQNTNNLSSSTAKYIHISPYRSSFGCPSVAPENYYMIEALANNGPGMILNWGREGMEDLEACTE